MSATTANKKKKTPSKSPALAANKKTPTSGQPRRLLEGTFIVEEILNKKIRESRTMYKIKWKDYPLASEQTWEPIENIRAAVTLIDDYEQKHTDRQAQLKKVKVNPALVQFYREHTIDKVLMTQVLGLDTANQVIFVLYDNAMVVTLQVKELDSKFIHAISCLIDKNFEKRFNANKAAFDQKVDTLKKDLKEQIKRVRKEVFPTQDDIRQLCSVIENALLENGWSKGEDATRIMVSPVVAQERTQHQIGRHIVDGFEIIQCTLCDTCGQCFDRPNVAFFQHLHQSGHNGSYLKTI